MFYLSCVYMQVTIPVIADEHSFSFLSDFLRALASWDFASACMQCTVCDARTCMSAHAFACKFLSKILRPHACNVQSVTRAHACFATETHARTRTIFTHWHAFFTLSRMTGWYERHHYSSFRASFFFKDRLEVDMVDSYSSHHSPWYATNFLTRDLLQVSHRPWVETMCVISTSTNYESSEKTFVSIHLCCRDMGLLLHFFSKIWILNYFRIGTTKMIETFAI